MKKILFLINALRGGGAEKVLIDTVNALDKSKYQITVQTVIDGGVLKNRLGDDVEYKSIVKAKNPFLRRLCTYAVNYILPPKMVHRLFIGKGYDYEIAFLEGVPTKLISASDDKNSIKYAWVHIDLYNTFGLDKVHKNMQKHIECYKKFDRIVCVSESVKETFIKRFGDFDDLIVKYNIIDDKAIIEKSKEPVQVSNKLRVVTVGRVENQKGFDRLLRIHKKLSDEGFDYELMIVGEGSKRAELEEYVRANNLSDSVVFTGFTDNPYKYMASADMIVYPSRAEGYSTVAVEAVILGKSVIATDCSGMREIFGDSEHGFVTENDEDAICSAMKKMLSDKDLREEYAKKAKSRSRDFGKSVRIKELEELFS